MVRLLRVLVLVVVGVLLFKAGLRLASGTTGPTEKAAVLAMGCVWLLAVVRGVRPLLAEL